MTAYFLVDLALPSALRVRSASFDSPANEFVDQPAGQVDRGVPDPFGQRIEKELHQIHRLMVRETNGKKKTTGRARHATRLKGRL